MDDRRMTAEGWFPADDDALQAPQREYLVALRGLARDWPAELRDVESGVVLEEAVVTAYVDIPDTERDAIIATLRSDFDGRVLWMDWDKGCSVGSGDTLAGAGREAMLVDEPAACAAASSAWLLEQLALPIERREWDELGARVRTEWWRTDDDVRLVWSDHRNERETPDRPPDRVVTFSAHPRRSG